MCNKVIPRQSVVKSEVKWVWRSLLGIRTSHKLTGCLKVNSLHTPLNTIYITCGADIISYKAVVVVVEWVSSGRARSRLTCVNWNAKISQLCGAYQAIAELWHLTRVLGLVIWGMWVRMWVRMWMRMWFLISVSHCEARNQIDINKIEIYLREPSVASLFLATNQHIHIFGCSALLNIKFMQNICRPSKWPNTAYT